MHSHQCHETLLSAAKASPPVVVKAVAAATKECNEGPMLLIKNTSPEEARFQHVDMSAEHRTRPILSSFNEASNLRAADVGQNVAGVVVRLESGFHPISIFAVTIGPQRREELLAGFSGQLLIPADESFRERFILTTPK